MNSDVENGQAGWLRLVFVVAMILLAAIARIAPHPWNITPVGAMALFGGALLQDRRLAFFLPLAALLAGDFFVGFHKLMPLVYASFLVNVALGFWLRRRRSIPRIAGATLAGSLQFFLITNFGVWALLGTFPHTLGGLLACYLAGLSFLGNTLAGDAIFVALLFGGFALAERIFPALRCSEAVAAR